MEADPTTEVRSSEDEALRSKFTNKIEKNSGQDEIKASHLLDDEIPLVDMTDEE